MKHLKIKIFCPILLLLVTSTTIGQNLLNNPESVVFDSTYNRYLVSNWGEDDGRIVQIDSSGTQSYFSTALAGQFKLAGLYIYNNTLLAAAGDAPNAGISAFDLDTGDTLFHIILPEVGLPNDITSDSNGIIYVTDYWGDKLYKIENQIPSIFINQGLDYPNGLMYDQQHHRLLIVSVMGPGSPILEVNLSNNSISTVVTTGVEGGDGITMDENRNVYISKWATQAIYKYDSTFSNPPELFSSGHNDPADIYYDKVNKLLAVPNFSSNTVDFIQITTSVFDNAENNLNQKLVLFQNYPNPFYQSTTIEYEILQETKVVLKIYDLFGKEVKTLFDGVQKEGKHLVVWDGTDNNNHFIPAGAYHFRIQAGKRIQCKKILFLK
ncbi:MAG: T9SS type A sorting domain-containing protein [Bacteroidales bacterium]|nr:T9SS type A sorting domain-containing protein [Bacteroidales bacterium]